MTDASLLAMFFLFTMTGVSAACYLLVLKPLRAVGEEAAEISNVFAGPDLSGPQAAVLDIFRMIGELIPQNSKQRDSLRKLLPLAGFRWPSAVSTFLGMKIATAFTLGIAGAWASLTFYDAGAPSLAALCGMGFGFLFPDRVLVATARSRGDRLRRGLPAALELMVLAVEAGQSVDAAVLESSRGLRTSHPDLASEFMQLHVELRTETLREVALRKFATRTQDSEIRKFASLLMDTDRFGSSLGPALRAHGHYLRTRFRQNAQERARKVSVKLIFPVFFFIFPSVILVTLGPAVVLIFQQMGKLVGQ